MQYEEADREDLLSLDFHSGLSPDAHFKSVVNIVAFLSFLQVVFYIGASYIYETVEAFVFQLFGKDALLYHAVLDVWDMFEYAGSFLLPAFIHLTFLFCLIFHWHTTENANSKRWYRNLH